MKAMRIASLLLCVLAVALGDCTYELLGEQNTLEPGQVGYKECPSGQNGFIKLNCDASSVLTEDASLCTAIHTSKVTYGMDKLTLKVGAAMPVLSLRSDGPVFDVAINPATLPNGLVFGANGDISGTPTEALEATQFTISANYEEGDANTAIQTVLTIEVVIVNCAAIDEFPTTLAGEIASSSMACPVGTSGVAKRTCGADGRWTGSLDDSGCSVLPLLTVVYPATTVARNERVELNPAYTKPDNSITLSFTATGLPAGVVISQTTGVIAGVPTVRGTFPISVTATTIKGPSSNTLNVAASLTVTEAKCYGMRDNSGNLAVKAHQESITQTCGELYDGTSSFVCNDGKFAAELRTFCKYKRPTITYPSRKYELVENEVLRTGRPFASNRVLGFTLVNPPNDHFVIDPETGEITGSSPEPMDVEYVVNAHNEDNVGEFRITISVVKAKCAATDDYSESVVGSTNEFDCTYSPSDGKFAFTGIAARACVVDADNPTVAKWELPANHCVRETDFMFLIISVVVMAVCIIVLIIAFVVLALSSKKRKTLPTTKPSGVAAGKKPAQKPAQKPASTKSAGTKPNSAKKPAPGAKTVQV